ncbi:hypothetical protein EIP86_006100 [Pleurotus ostreatoroseus]|nr:hypothetical protein EIP86_006100 [Pleurotus ostreatoroseus]
MIFVQVNQNDSVSRCFMHPDGFRCDLSAWRATTIAQKFDTSICENAMNTANASCVRGGSAILVGDGTFVFTIDPNAGKCADDSSLPDE